MHLKQINCFDCSFFLFSLKMSEFIDLFVSPCLRNISSVLSYKNGAEAVNGYVTVSMTR